MLIIPQIYLKNGKAVGVGTTNAALFKDDPMATAQAMKDAGVEILYLIDLAVPPVGLSPHLSIIKKIKDELKLSIYVDGGFKTLQSVETFINAGAELVVVGLMAYQQALVLEETCKKFPGKIATHIDLKGGHVTIPGYTVATNKTSFDYSDGFLQSGVRHFFYSEVGPDGLMQEEHFDSLTKFCKRVTARVVCTSEIRSPADIERIAQMNVPRLDGLVLAKSLYENKVDLRGTISMINNIALETGDESTLTDM